MKNKFKKLCAVLLLGFVVFQIGCASVEEKQFRSRHNCPKCEEKRR